MSGLRVQLVHGLEGSPKGPKAEYLRRRFELLAPAMDTSDFEGAVETQRAALLSFDPAVLVGSSFGGAVVMALLQRGAYRGPCLLLAPAGPHFGVELWLPDDVRVVLVHGTRDAVCPIEWSRALAAQAKGGNVELVEVDDEHRLSSLLGDERFAEWVAHLAQPRTPTPNR